jgi:antibiotic biosynthesis monooxygenase (ABM) superfamily enzyme
MSAQKEPVTVAVSRRVRPEREADFEMWARGISEAAEKFPGHLGAGHIRPAEAGGEHTIVYRFDTPEHFDNWQNSPERLSWIEASRGLIEGEPRIERATGLEYWFHDPACSYGTPPPVWKQAILTEIGLYPTVLVVAYTVGLLIAGWPLPVRSLVTTVLSVTLMTWVVMPVVSRVFRGWLQSKTST